MQMPWARLALDGAIFVVGFGAFFWILVVRPASDCQRNGRREAGAQPELRRAQLPADAAFGVLLLTEAGSRRIPLALLAGFTTMFLGDILWALGKVGGGYLSGGLQDVLYVACYLPIAIAARGQLRVASAPIQPSSAVSASLARALPYGAMLVAFVVLVYVARAEVSGPVAEMTIVVFVVTLLIMLRQGTMLATMRGSVNGGRRNWWRRDTRRSSRMPRTSS